MGASAVVFDGITSPEVLEAWACSEALSLAEDLPARKLKVASDCLNAVKEIQAGSAKGQHSMVIFTEIISRKKFFLKVEIIHERREANEEAHMIARTATSLDVGRHVWLINPPIGMGIPVNILS
jgi:ribonuclease HI